MTDNLTLEQKKSRRGLLALVGAGGAAAVAALLGRRHGAEAHGTVHYDSSSPDPAVHGDNTDDGPGVLGSGIEVGVRGEALGTGVSGEGTGGPGVYGTSQGDIGVWGNCPSTTGVKGSGKPGVHGICSKDNGSGVRGDGDGPGTIGLFGKNTPGRRALRTKGKVQMDCARTTTVSARSTKVTLPWAVRAGTNAAVMATVQGNPGNDAVIWRAYRVDSTHIRIVFNKAPANPVSVAYWVVHTG